MRRRSGQILCRGAVIRLTLQRPKPRIAGLYRSGPYCTLDRKQWLQHRAASWRRPGRL